MEELVTFLLLEFTAFFGLWCHWYKKHYRLQTFSDFWGYLSSHPKHTRRAVMAVGASIVAFFQLGDVVINSQWLANAFMAGYGFDSLLNKTKEEI